MKSNNIWCYRVSPVDISFVRFRMFYSRPNYIPDTKHILVGLPLKRKKFSVVRSMTSPLIFLLWVDVLNQIHPAYLWHSKGKSKQKIDIEDPRQNAERARQLSKYVFARQYGLKNPFNSAGASKFGYDEYIDREVEIKARSLFFFLDLSQVFMISSSSLVTVKRRRDWKRFFRFSRKWYDDTLDVDIRIFVIEPVLQRSSDASHNIARACWY